MKTGLWVASLAALATPLVAKSPGPVHLVSCVVSGSGLLEAEVSNTSGSELSCHLRCGYVIREDVISHRFDVVIPARFKGRVGQFDTSSGRPGTYPGSVESCQRHQHVAPARSGRLSRKR